MIENRKCHNYRTPFNETTEDTEPALIYWETQLSFGLFSVCSVYSVVLTCDSPGKAAEGRRTLDAGARFIPFQ
jgi:hypothetical protein